MNFTVQQGSYSFFHRAQTAEDAVDFLNDVVHIGGILTIRTPDAEYKCDLDNSCDLLRHMGIYKCRRCPCFQTESHHHLCYDCYTDKYSF